ncbi:MAG: hypothetical protein QXX08_01005 [Candidatus Bathyarchaeia archaeon]
MGDFEEALRNIDVFCKVLVKKLIEDEKEQNCYIALDPMEKILKKYISWDYMESKPLAKFLTPLPQSEEPLIDVFEDKNYVRVFVQCCCEDQKVTVKVDSDSIMICERKHCINIGDLEICNDICQKLELPAKNLQFQNMIAKCINNIVFQVDIPKIHS